MMRSRPGGWSGWRARRTLWSSCVGVALGLALSAAGCGDTYSPGPEPGGSKGPEMKASMTQGQRTGSASQMNQSTATFPTPVTTAPCGTGLACIGGDGCVGACDANTGLITACATCDNTGYADCTQHACTPAPQ